MTSQKNVAQQILEQAVGTRPIHVQIGRTSQVCGLAFERITGIHPTRWRVLVFLHKNGKTTQSELARALAIDAGAITRMLKQLEKKNWITRNSDAKDNRFTNVALTSTGESLYDRFSAHRDEYLAVATAGLNSGDINILMKLLQHIESNLANRAKITIPEPTAKRARKGLKK